MGCIMSVVGVLFFRVYISVYNLSFYNAVGVCSIRYHMGVVEIWFADHLSVIVLNDVARRDTYGCVNQV